MGMCIVSYGVFNSITNKFIKYNVIDKEHNIVIGIYSDYNKSIKSNTMINQGICIGYNNNLIHKIKFGIIHREMNIIELYFENNIKLVFIQEKNEKENKIKIILTVNDLTVKKYIDLKVIEKIKLINNNSEYIDLLFDLL